MAARFRPRLACLAVAFALSGQALAIGLGPVSGSAVIGQPLRVRVALIGANEGPLDASCFRLRGPAAPMDAEYVLRDGQLRVESVQGQSRLVVSSTSSLRQPVVEFRIIASCGGAEVARDYLLLASLPVPPEPAAKEAAPVPKSPEPVREAPAPRAAAAAPPLLPASSLPVSATGESLQLKAATNLNAIARQRYPDNREARDTFRQRMAEANPELFVGKGPIGAVPLAAGTVLNMPGTLPEPLAAPAAPAKPTLAAPPATPRTPPQEATPAAAAKGGGKPDRLVIGGSSTGGVKPMSPRELAGAVNRLERMVEDQGRLHLGMNESLRNLEIAFGDIRGNLQAFEERMKKLEVERAKAEAERAKTMAQLAEERSRFGFLEMLALVLASGGMGAGLIHYYHRLQARRWRDEAAPVMTASPASDASPVPVTGFESIMTAAVVEPEVARPASRPPLAPAKPMAPVPSPRPVASEPAPSVQAPRPVVAAGDAAPRVVTSPAVQVPPPVVEPSPLDPPKTIAPELEIPLEFGTSKAVVEPPPVEVVAAPMIEFTLEELAPGDVAVAPTPTFAAKPQAPVVDAFAQPPSTSAGDPTLELADLMHSMGLAQGAAQTLVEHIRGNPTESVAHWLKFLDLYHAATVKGDLDESVKELKANFNVAIGEWTDPDAAPNASLVEYRHLAKELIGLWPRPECDEFLVHLITDTRQGTRVGFPRSVVEEILLLRAVLSALRAPD